MEQRYEIREQLGKGGIGAVYLAYDRHLKREVAIKRILAEANAEDRETARKQLTEEASTLCALQHPNIVTVYDVGFDEDSPFVVMELLTGRTLEELVEQAPLTWEDFRQLAPQTQEALIAAQERHLVHRDIKPGNVMLNWLPSGKFQVKLVDFGLAKFSPQPTLQEIGKDDSVFGSIFFMAPEQFERKPLDARTDMYAMGCVYYYALTSEYPFTGATGQEVMMGHLEHRVHPLHERRPDIPRWTADWVMWHMNRNPEDRPADAREALKQFIMNDESKSQPLEPNEPAAPVPRRPKLIIPGAQPSAQQPPPGQPAPPAQQPPAPAQQPAQAAPPPVQPPLPPVQPAAPASPAPASPARPEPRATTPQPLQPPVGSKPSVHDEARKATGAVATPQPPVGASVEPAAVALTPATQQGAPPAQPPGGQPPMGAAPGQTPQPGQTLAPGVAIGAPTAKKKKKISNGAMVAIAAVLGLIVVALGAVLIYRVSKNKKAKIYNALVIQAKDPDVKKISVKKEQIEILLDAATFIGKASERETIYQCLLLAESVDGTDVDKTIAERAVAPVLAPDIRIKLFKVLERRGNSEVLPTLLGFAENPGKMTPSKMNEIAAALEACRKMGGDENFGQFLDVLENTDNVQVQKAAETTVGQIIDRSKNSGKLASLLAAAYDKQVDEDRRLAIIRLLGHAGGDQARDIVEKALGSDDPKDQIAAIFAVGAWPDDSMFETLMDYLADCEDLSLRRRAFDAGRRFLNNPRRKRSPEDSEDYWKMLAGNAKTNGEMIAIIDDVARQKGDWVISVIEYFADTAENDKVIDRAEKALDFVRERERVEKKDDGGE